jgi:hypothetical protein
MLSRVPQPLVNIGQFMKKRSVTRAPFRGRRRDHASGDRRSPSTITRMVKIVQTFWTDGRSGFGGR